MNLRFLRPFALLGAAFVSAAEPKAPAAPAPEAVRTAPPAARADSPVAPAGTFDAFRLIVDRNIFNPNRSGRRERVAEEKAPRVDTITLVGTMESNRHGLTAFFDGSEAEFRKALRVGESIAQFKVTRIGPEGIDVEREGKPIAMRVGQQFRRPEGADWSLVGPEAVRPETQAMGSMRPDPTAPPVIPANADEVTRRMMERRQKQLKQ